MSPIEAPYVIIMNEDLESNHTQWRVVHRDKTLAAARLHGQYADALASFPRDRYTAVKLETKTLIHTPSGITKGGSIYKLSEVAARVRIRKLVAPAGVMTRRIKLSTMTVKGRSVILEKKRVKVADRTFAPIIIIKKKNKPDIKRTYAPIITKKSPKSPKSGRE